MKNKKCLSILGIGVIPLLLTGCGVSKELACSQIDTGGSDENKELICSKDWSPFFVEEANYDEWTMTKYNRTVEQKITLVYNSDETNVAKVNVEYVAKATGTDYATALERLSYELTEECKNRGFESCESVFENNIYTITGSNDEWSDIQTYMDELKISKNASLNDNKNAFLNFGYSCMNDANSNK